MNSYLAGFLRALVPPMEGKGPVARFLHKVRRKTFRLIYPPVSGYVSQNGQDYFVDTVIFKHRQGGTFVDIGANDGVTISNTYFLEKTRLWTGVCVEPHPEVFKKLQAARSSLCVEACVADKSSVQSFLQIDGSSDALSGLTSQYDPDHIERIRSEVSSGLGSSREIEVRCHTFAEIVRMGGLRHVDYLSIDIEGGEMDVLKTIDFSSIAISLLSVENNYFGGRLENFMKSRGYSLIAVIGDDEFYQKQER